MGCELPGVTVVTPCYNGEKYFRRAIECVAGQTYRGEIRHIVVDDGSTDHSAEMVRSAREPITLIQKPNGGFASAMNSGIRAVETPLVS